MIRGTTPTLEFILPFSTDLLAEAWVTLSQNRAVVLNKQLEDLRADEKKLFLKLTQQETLQLTAGTVTEIQIRCRTNDGDALASDIISVSTDRILKDGVI